MGDNVFMGHPGENVIAQRGFDTWEAIEDFHRSNYTKKEFRHVKPAYSAWLRTAGHGQTNQYRQVREELPGRITKRDIFFIDT